MELEVLAKKFDRFRWENDRGTPVHDRLITDWMDALQDYTLQEIRIACRTAVIRNPDRMPNEGHVIAEISEARRQWVAARSRQRPAVPPTAGTGKISEEERARRVALAASLGLRTFGAES